MKKLSIFLLLSTVFGTGFAQSTSVINDKNAVVRNVSGFHGIKVSNGIDLYITQGTEEGVAISASEEKYRDKIKTVVENGILKIYYDAGSANVHITWGDKKMKAYVSVKNIDHIEASGGSDINVKGTLQATTLSVHASGGSDFFGDINTGNLSVSVSGGSDVKATGKATVLSVDASGGSDFHGYELSTDNCILEASGGSDIYITVNKELTIKASGGSDVSYKGGCVIKAMNVSGSSDVSKKS